jgi:hypothetical protein
MTRGAAAAAITVTLIGVLGLSACESPGPTEVPTPAIVWETPEPTGAPYDDPYVQAAYAASLGFVIASNSADFTVSQLTGTTTAKRIDEMYQAHIARFGTDNQNPIVYVGPPPRSVISVEENADGSGAVVRMCDISGEWYVSADHADATTEGVAPLSLRLVVVDDGGTLKLDEVLGGDVAECDASDAAIGRFEPEPEPSPGSVRRPLD